MASKQPRRSDLNSDLKSTAQTTYATMFVWTVLVFFGQMIKKEEFVSTRVVGFATTKNRELKAFI